MHRSVDAARVHAKFGSGNALRPSELNHYSFGFGGQLRSHGFRATRSATATRERNNFVTIIRHRLFSDEKGRLPLVEVRDTM